MVQKNKVYDETVKFKGHFNYSELYNFCFQWLKDEGYFVKEEEYVEKISGSAKEVRIKWVAIKKVTDYFRNDITLKFHIIGMSDAEVEVNGKKEKTNKGDLKLVFEGELTKDYENKWDENPTNKFLRGIYDRYIIRTTIDEYEDRVWEKTESFVENVKSFLNLEGKR